MKSGSTDRRDLQLWLEKQLLSRKAFSLRCNASDCELVINRRWLSVSEDDLHRLCRKQNPTETKIYFRGDCQQVRDFVTNLLTVAAVNPPEREIKSAKLPFVRPIPAFQTSTA